MRFNESVLHGALDYVINVGVGELTQNPANDLGESGFQFPVHVTVPKLPSPKRHR